MPGYYQFEKRRQALTESKGKLVFKQSDSPATRQAVIGSGQILLGNLAEDLLARVPVKAETMTQHGLSFIRRQSDDDHAYFLVNFTASAIDEWIPLAVNAKSAALLDPLTGNTDRALTKSENGKFFVYLQLASGQSCILRAFDRKEVRGDIRPVYGPEEKSITLEGEWQVEFIQGGPVLPKPVKTNLLRSWTTFPDEECRRFAGTARYTLTIQVEVAEKS